MIAALCLSLALAFQADKSERKGPVQFSAEVDQVVIYASVYDSDGQLVSDLKEEDFKVYEDKTLQDVTYFGQDDIASTIGLVMDRSGSMRDKWDLANQAVQLFLTMSHPENELFLIGFNDEVEPVEEFTRDPYDIRDALNNMIISGGTSLYDAVYLTVEEAVLGAEPRKVVIVFTDGEDKDSYYTHQELIEKIQESEVQVHIVAFLDSDLEDSGGFFGIFKSEKKKIQEQIEAIASNAGGKAFFPEEIEKLDEVFAAIAQDLRNQYRLAYVSTNPAEDGSWREIDVLLENAKERGLKMRAKKGYYAEKGETAEKRGTVTP